MLTLLLLLLCLMLIQRTLEKSVGKCTKVILQDSGIKLLATNVCCAELGALGLPAQCIGCGLAPHTD